MRALVPLVTMTLLFGGAGAAAATTTAGPVRSPAKVVVGATGEPVADGAWGAYSYDPQLVPPGARIAVLSVSRGGHTTSLFAVRGLLPDRAYGAHLHVNACGADPAAAGPHYQQIPDPTQPSVDPAYANPVNEVWLDVRTNGSGAAAKLTGNPWTYRQPPGSLVIHANSTSHDHGTAGQAGARVACLTLRVRD